MKKIYFILLFLFLFINYSTFASDSLRVAYKVTDGKDCKILKLTIEINDTTEFSYHDNLNSLSQSKSLLPGNIDTESLEAKIASQIKENKDIELYINRPDYFNEILDLIKTKNDKEKAMVIYDKHFGNSAINLTRSYSTNSSYSSSNNKRNNDNKNTSKTTVNITIYLKVKKNTKMVLTSLKLIDNFKFYDTYKLEMDIEN